MTRFVKYAALICLFLLASCNDKKSAESLGDNELHQYSSIYIAGFPNQIDVFNTSGADKAVVFLHGGGGTNYHVEYQLGINQNDAQPFSATINWDVLSANKMIAVFPQGLAIPQQPNAYTWSNHVMTSGQDDVAFLQSLASYIRTQYGISRVYLAGHSNGGMMANRMWCESPETYDGYISLAGPASVFYLTTACNPAVAKPYYGIVGDSDNVLQNSGAWEAQVWAINNLLVLAASDAFVDPNVLGEWYQQNQRAQLMCTEALGSQGAVAGTLETWSNCGGKLILQKVVSAPHNLDVLNSAVLDGNGITLVDLIVNFIDSINGSH